MRLIPLAGDEFLPKCQRGGDVIEVNKLISTLQDNVHSCVLDPHSVIIGAEKEEKRPEQLSVPSFLSHSEVIRISSGNLTP